MAKYFIDAYGRYVIISGKIVRKYKIAIQRNAWDPEGILLVIYLFSFSKNNLSSKCNTNDMDNKPHYFLISGNILQWRRNREGYEKYA